MKNSMTISTFKSVALLLPSQTSVLLRGIHGIGKSKLIRWLTKAIAKKNGKPANYYQFIDRRLSQLTEGDIIGLPSTDGNVTRFNPPDWYMQACQTPCILFLDELNRATQEVMQAAFQIVLDHELNGFKLHPETRVYAAINNSSNYSVNEMDPALLDRFWTIDLSPDLNDWVTWARDTDPEFGGNIDPVIIDFIVANEKFLDPLQKEEEPGTVTPSRRSWEHLSNAIKGAGLAEKPEDNLFYPICLGYVGVNATIAYVEFATTVGKRISAEEVLNGYSTVQAKAKALTHERQNALIEKVADYVLKNLTTVSDEQGQNLKKFMNDLLNDELRLICWTKMTAAGAKKLELAKSIHKHCAEIVLQCFGVPMGEAGIGVTPNIPSIFKKGAA